MRGNDTTHSVKHLVIDGWLVNVHIISTHTGGVCFLWLLWTKGDRPCRWHKAVLCWLQKCRGLSYVVESELPMDSGNDLHPLPGDIRRGAGSHPFSDGSSFGRMLLSSGLGVWLRALIHFFFSWFLFLNIQLFINIAATYTYWVWYLNFFDCKRAVIIFMT